MKQSKFVGNIGKYAIYESNGKGKVGNAPNATKSIQVREYNGDDSYLLKKQFSYPVAIPDKRGKALEKAKQYCSDNQ